MAPADLAALVAALHGGRTLHVGEPLRGWPASAGGSATLASHEMAHAQLAQRFATVVVTAPPALDEGWCRAALHTAMHHLVQGGHLLVARMPATVAVDLLREAVEPLAEGTFVGAHVAVLRRTARRTVHDLVADARNGLRRLRAAELAAALASPAPPLVLDTRTPSDRQRHGTIAGAHHVPRTVLEWRLDPANGYLHPAVTGFTHPLVVVCNHGYSSSLAAANLQAIGYTAVADLVGGMAAWRAAGLPVVPPDHTFLEL